MSNLFDFTLRELHDYCVASKLPPNNCKFCPFEEDCIALFNIAPCRWGKRIKELDKEGRQEYGTSEVHE